MKLSQILLSFRREFIGPIPKHRGNVLIGKKKFVPPVTNGKKIGLVRELIIEEQTMKYLSQPYITKEQENSYLESKGCSRPPYWDDPLRATIEEPLKQRYGADFIEKLDVSRSFQEEN